MGFFKSLKKLGSKLVSGVKKVFSTVGKAVGKVLNSGLGKVLMVALTVVTLGSALMAGFTKFAAGMAGSQGFTSSFIAGSKAFMQSLMGKEAAGAAGEAVAGTAPTLDITASAVEAGSGVGGLLKAGDAVTQATSVPTSIAPAVSQAAAATQAAPGLLAKTFEAAKGVGQFLNKNEGVANIAGQVLKGYAQGKQAEEMLKEQQRQKERTDRLWANFDVKGLQANVDPTNSATANSVITPLYDRPFREETTAPKRGVLQQATEATRQAGQGRVDLDRDTALSTSLATG